VHFHGSTAGLKINPAGAGFCLRARVHRCLLPALLALAPAGRAIADLAAIPAVPLHVEGVQLKDSSGKVVVPRGVNQPGFVDVPDGAWDAPGQPLYSGMGHWNPELVKATLAEYRRLGFNVVRFHAVIDWWKRNPQEYRDRWRAVRYAQPYRRMIKDTIQCAGERGLYVIFDFFAMKNIDGRQSGQETLPWAPHSRFPEVVTNQLEFVDLTSSSSFTTSPMAIKTPKRNGSTFVKGR
jgi:hypothetical protein